MKRINIRFNGCNLEIDYFILQVGRTPVITRICVKNEDITELVGYDIKNSITFYLKNKLQSLA